MDNDAAYSSDDEVEDRKEKVPSKSLHYRFTAQNMNEIDSNFSFFEKDVLITRKKNEVPREKTLKVRIAKLKAEIIVLKAEKENNALVKDIIF